jgi:RNA polymerase sigma factor (sigma-70 family)
MGRETDAELIAASRRGETGAFGLIVERYQRVVVAVAFAAVRDRVLAEDIAQDTFVMAWSKLGSLKDSERLPAWLCGIARNLARARRRKLDREQSEVDVAGGSTPYDQLDERQTEAIVADALARVPETFREPLLLFYCEERSAKDVARMLGTTDQAVHQRLSRGRQYLAADAELFEHAVGRTMRPRRDLAAAVIAAIAIGVGTSSRVEANPRPRARGTKPMLKIGAVVVATAGLAGTGVYLAHHSAGESRAESAHGSPAVGFTGSSLMSLHDAAHGSTSPAPSGHVPSLPNAGAADPWKATTYENLKPVSAECADVASHLTDLSLSNSMVAGGGEQHFAMASSMVKTHFEQACASGWTPEFIACAKAASDPFSMHFDCKKLAPADDVAPLEKHAFFITQDPDATFAPEKDFDCASVAKHIAAMHSPNLDAQVPPEIRSHLKDGFEKARAAIAEMVEAGCSSGPWSEARRRCVASATTVAALDTCD